METNQPPSAGLPLPKTAIEKCLQEDFPPSSSQLTNGISEIYYILLVLEKDWIRILSLKAFFAQLPQHKGMVTVFAKAHEALCTNLPSLTFSEAEDTFTSQLDALIREPTLKEHLVYIALTNFAAIMGYGRQNRLFLEVYEDLSWLNFIQGQSDSSSGFTLSDNYENLAIPFTFRTLSCMLRHRDCGHMPPSMSP
ncbi:hypothetical protein CIHG_00980 [Coccidioides immitis H538.4]|uniref:Uncharacterized protein n=1 Tax=Coccidioides immitis H538.4 TaxID=396776 RepID=A0A0J8U840_COCIT|nr:hypothetical protein CIHG_00980 [Coccidioides immitis H538.4]